MGTVWVLGIKQEEKRLENYGVSCAHIWKRELWAEETATAKTPGGEWVPGRREEVKKHTARRAEEVQSEKPVRTLVFIPSKMGSHWQALSRRVT